MIIEIIAWINLSFRYGNMRINARLIARNLRTDSVNNPKQDLSYYW
ncbi:MAG: hypothetical protein Q8868_09395 [Bacteroidota bacterium]|nr:hypothetical protein [Bacteroidota bacterium]